MKTHWIIQLVIWLLAPLSTLSLAQMIDLKPPAMGYLSLVLDSETTGLNLYDFGSNPAWLINDQSRGWFSVSSLAKSEAGKFRRRYDPEKFFDFSAGFEGVKILDQNQAFWGAANYHAFSLTRVSHAINRTPYDEHPFRATDETEGNFDYWGPSVIAQYSRQLVMGKLYWGASLGYRIETGLKDQFPQPRIIDREVITSTGFAWRIFDPLIVGILLQYDDAQEFIEAQSSSQLEQRTIVITLFRGETIGVKRLGMFEQFTNRRNFGSQLQLHFRRTELGESIMSLGCRLQRLEIFESSVRPVLNAKWNNHSLELHWKNRMNLFTMPLQLGWSFDYDYSNDWAVHPDFDLLWGDDYSNQYQVGVGLAFSSPSSPLFFSIEYQIDQIHHEKNDYISRLFAAGKIKSRELRCGTEFTFFNRWKIRAGYTYQLNLMPGSLLSFSEFLPEHHRYRMTFGLANHFKQVAIELAAFYGCLQAEHQNRHSFFTLINAKIYRGQ
ncbi:MAG: hypothetical protein ONB32_14285 [candidate division KSB1 bacterium]|nr:hypothetical protein [candidate division KSB1 bacterium]